MNTSVCDFVYEIKEQKSRRYKDTENRRAEARRILCASESKSGCD
jgi:hypothetical protein